MSRGRPLAALLLLSLLAAAPAAGGEGRDDPFAALGMVAPRERRPAPAFALEDLSGRSVALADYGGRVVLVNFWATWCKPCVAELPALDALARDAGDRGLTVLAVNVDRGRRGHVKKFAAGLGLSLPVLLDADGEARRAYAVRALPITYLIGRDGRFLGRVLGDRPWDDSAHRAALEALLAAGADATAPMHEPSDEPSEGPTP